MGALFLTGDKVLRCPGLEVEAHSTVGAGDAMTAALAYGFSRGLPLGECAKLSIATSAGAVTTKGRSPRTELVEELLQKVEIIALE